MPGLSHHSLVSPIIFPIFDCMKLTTEFKQKIFDACIGLLTDRVNNARTAMEDAQEAANGEEKSSAGDKYETSRAMGQRDREMYARQLVEAQNELNKIDRLNLEPVDVVKLGSLVMANDDIFFILTGIGKVQLDHHTVMVISKESPLAAAMLGNSVNQEFVWNTNKWKIQEIG